MICATQERRTRPETLGDIVDFASRETLPSVGWLTRLSLDRPRRDVRCLRPSTRIIKRTMDIVISATALAVLAPVMIIVAILVKCTSPGPVIFRQTRVGLNLRCNHADRRQNPFSRRTGLDERRRGLVDRRSNMTYGRHFTLYKFRTMWVDAERHGARFAIPGDDRVTPIGRFLRRTRLDELPQLWNVLRGEMSLVGPRPERPEFIENLSREIPDYLQRLGLKPGLTGIAQVINGYDNNLASFRRKVALDLLYLQNCCLVNDLKILLRTIRVVLNCEGL